MAQNNILSLELIREKTYIVRGRKEMLDQDLVENDALRSQFVTLKRGQHRKYLPYAFTENGVAMLSSCLRSKSAIQINIQTKNFLTFCHCSL